MKLKLFVAVACLGFAAIASARTQVETQVETKLVTVDGEVIRYEPGRTIVIRGADSKEMSYTLSPTIVMPAEVAVGRRVTLYTNPSTGGATTVTRVTTSVTPEGNIKKTTEVTKTQPSGATMKTTTTTISGKVEAYESGKTLTILRSDGTKATYLINPKSKVPADLAVGKMISILPLDAAGEPVVQTITYTVVKQ